MTLISKVTLDEVCFGKFAVSKGEPLDSYIQQLGPPSRSESHGKPAPFGHRNNVFHFYDARGFFLREHHATRLIQGIDFQLDNSHSVFPAASSFSGALRVCGVDAYAGMLFEDFASKCMVIFRPHLGHAWYVDGDRISIQFEVYKDTIGKGRSHVDRISEVAVGFVGAHRIVS